MARVRQWLAAGLLGAALAVLAIYLQGRRHHQAEKTPATALLGLNIQQSASGLTISKDDHGKPVFRIQAARADKLRQNGHDVLHQVRILVYDKDGVDADEIAGDEFSYDEASGELGAAGQTHISLLRHAGTNSAVHVDAAGLSYNVKQGTGTIANGLRFAYAGAQGSAARAEIDSRTGTLGLAGAVAIAWKRADGPPVDIAGERATVVRLPKGDADAATITLEGGARLDSGTQKLAARQLVFVVSGKGADNSLRRMDAVGDVTMEDVSDGRRVTARAQRAEADFVPLDAHRIATSGARMSGGVTIEQAANHLRAGRVNFVFGRDHQLTGIIADQAARLTVAAAKPESIAAPGLRFALAPGRTPQLSGVVAIGRAEIHSGDTDAMADRLNVAMDTAGHPTMAEAGGNVVWMQTLAKAQRRGTSDNLTVRFTAGQVASAVERGAVTITQGDQEVRAAEAAYTAADQTVDLTGGVAGQDPQTRFHARQARWTGAANGGGHLHASGGVSVQRSGGMATIVAGTGTVVITSDQMDWTLGADKSSHGDFTGGVRLMQSPNLLRADQVAINATAQTLTAAGHVTTNLAQNGKPVTIAAGNLRFEQAKHSAIYENGVKLSSAQGTLLAPQLAVQLNPKGGGLESGLASGGVELTQVGRIAKAEQVDYDFKQQRIVLSGGSPSITDAEHGEVSGDPLTFLMASDEIQVGGKPGARAKGVTKATGQIPHNGRQHFR